MKSPQSKTLPLQPATKPFRVTIFGAESTGKTTLSRQLATKLEATWVYEFARPYLEITKQLVTIDSMSAIWRGQMVLQTMASGSIVIQDTDLFSTIAYWEFPHWRPIIGECPIGLIKDAQQLKSDLYIITPSNIPFEPDALRTGGNKREGSDAYWITICKKYHLNYVVLSSTDQDDRIRETLHHIQKARRASCVD